MKFRFQHVVVGFIADFFAPAIGLVVEVDGPVHADQRDHDEARARTLESHGLRVVRLSNEQVLEHIDAALASIRESIVRRQLERVVDDTSRT